jgi:hypothetical protein
MTSNDKTTPNRPKRKRKYKHGGNNKFEFDKKKDSKTWDLAIRGFRTQMPKQRIAKMCGISDVTLDEELKRNKPFALAAFAANPKLEVRAREHAIKSAFPIDKEGNWQKGDPLLARFLLETMFGLKPDRANVQNNLQINNQSGQAVPGITIRFVDAQPEEEPLLIEAVVENVEND